MHSYIVIEIQSGAVGPNNWTYADPEKSEEENVNEAFAKYHTVLADAAKSAVACHTAVILREDGTQIARQSFYHGQQPPEE